MRFVNCHVIGGYLDLFSLVSRRLRLRACVPLIVTSLAVSRVCFDNCHGDGDREDVFRQL